MVLLNEFRRGMSAAHTGRNTCEVFGADAVTGKTWDRWFKKFRSDNFYLENARESWSSSGEADGILKKGD